MLDLSSATHTSPPNKSRTIAISNEVSVMNGCSSIYSMSCVTVVLHLSVSTVASGGMNVNLYGYGTGSGCFRFNIIVRKLGDWFAKAGCASLIIGVCRSVEASCEWRGEARPACFGPGPLPSCFETGLSSEMIGFCFLKQSVAVSVYQPTDLIATMVPGSEGCLPIYLSVCWCWESLWIGRVAQPPIYY